MPNCQVAVGAAVWAGAAVAWVDAVAVLAADKAEALPEAAMVPVGLKAAARKVEIWLFQASSLSRNRNKRGVCFNAHAAFAF